MDIFQKSILNDIKKLLGIMEDYNAFDQDIMIYINSAFATLNQLGAGPDETFAITGPESTWQDFSSDDVLLVAMCKTYIYLRVRKIFDPPTSSFVMSGIDDQISEYEFRINIHCDPKTETEE